MCTVTWLREDAGYQLLCNRDERKTRGIAAEPQTYRSAANIAYLSPRDSDQGGTWLAANERGLTLCLLNGNGDAALKAMSRGLLPQWLIDARDASEAMLRLPNLELERFRPFTLAALDLMLGVHIAHWDGASLSVRCDDGQTGLLTSSSLDEAKARELRRSTFASVDRQSLLDFHRSHAGDTRFTPCMHREDAETVSFSWISCDASEVRFYYAAGSPCRGDLGQTWRLPCIHKS